VLEHFFYGMKSKIVAKNTIFVQKRQNYCTYIDNGMEVGLGPGHIVLDGDAAPP